MKYMIALFLMALASVLTCSANAAESLCAPTEEIFFSCSLGKKIVSICASSDYSATSGTLQYRFGPKGAPEMSWPEPATSRAGISFGNIMYSGGGMGYIRFAKGPIGYVVYSGMGKGWEKEGVMVEQNGKKTANLLCKEAADQDLWHTGLPEESQDQENATEDEIP